MPTTTATATTPANSNSNSNSTSNSTSFPVDSSLLHPTFESYSLVQSQGSISDPQDQDQGQGLVQCHYPLPSQLSLSEITNPSGSILGHKDAKDRSSLSHLTPRINPKGKENESDRLGMAAYVDLQGFLMLIVVDQTSQPTFHPLCHLDVSPIPTSDSPLSPSPPPSILSLPGNRWLVTLGDGSLTLVKSRSVPNALKPGSDSKRWTGDVLKQWKVVDEELGKAGSNTSDRRIAFRLLDMKFCEGEKAIEVLIQSSRRIVSDSSRPQPGLGGSSSSSSAHSSFKNRSSRSRTVFDVSALRIELPSSETTSTSTEHLTRCWTVTGDEPSFCSSIFPSNSSTKSRYLLCSEGGFVVERRRIDPPISTPDEPSLKPQQFPPPGSAAGKSNACISRPQPYSWHQTSDTITVVFALPPSVKKEQVRSHFQNQSLSVSISPEARSQNSLNLNDDNRFQEIGDEEEETEAGKKDHHSETLEKMISGQYKSRNLWGEIDIEGSLWTLEGPERPSSGLKELLSLLTLHLEKKHHGTRWLSVFKEKKNKSARGMKVGAVESVEDRGDDGEEVDDDDSNVPETMDPIELLNAVEGLEKYTASHQDQLGENGMQNVANQINADGFGPEQPSLLRDGLEEEDAEVGKPIVVSWIKAAARESEDEVKIDISRPKGDSFKKELVLASPLATSERNSLSLVIKNGLDGLVFHPSSNNSEQESWTHSDTLPALSFVLASKKDAHRVYIHSSSSSESEDSIDKAKESVGPSTILAFESPAPTSQNSSSESTGGAGNLFVYYSPTFTSTSDRRKRSKYSKSRVVRLGVEEESGKGSGALVGAAALRVNGKDLLLCLCEKSLLVLHNLL